jgi:type II secretory pathway component PulL
LAATDIYTYFSLHREIKLITQESQELVKRLVPELDYVADGQERTYAEKILSRQSQGASPSSLPRMLVAITPVFRSENILLKDLLYEPSELTISGYISNLGQVDSVVKKLDRLPTYTAKLQGTSSEGDTIVATFVVASEQDQAEVN